MIARSFLTICLLLLAGCGQQSPPASAPLLTVAPPGASATPDGAFAVNPVPDTDVVVSAVTATPPPTETAPPPTPTPTVTPSPSPTPTPALRQLTQGQCCVNPSWRADGQSVRFIDRPTASMPAGYYEVPLSTEEPLIIGELVTETLGTWSHRDRFYLIPGPDGYTVIDNESGQRYQTDSTGNNRPNISPDGARLAYQVSDQSPQVPFNERFASLYISALDGSNEQLILQGRGTSFAGWLDDGQWLLSIVSPDDPEERLLRRLTLDSGETVDLARGTRIQGTSISPDGRHIVYFVTLDRREPERNGYWLTDTQTGETRTLPFAGAYRWRSEGKLLIIPFEPGAPSFRVQEYDVESDTLRDLTDPASVAFRIHNNDWSLSPDGNRIVFVNADDRNLWVIELPEK